MNKAIELTQQVYFDVCDLLNGESYTSIGYENKKDFLLCIKDKLAELEVCLTNQGE